MSLPLRNQNDWKIEMYPFSSTSMDGPAARYLSRERGGFQVPTHPNQAFAARLQTRQKNAMSKMQTWIGEYSENVCFIFLSFDSVARARMAYQQRQTCHNANVLGVPLQTCDTTTARDKRRMNPDWALFYSDEPCQLRLHFFFLRRGLPETNKQTKNNQQGHFL